MPDNTPLARLADHLDARRPGILADWRDRVRRDASLATTSEWTRKQFYDHFPDVLEAYGRILRHWPDTDPNAEIDQFIHAHAHAKTRWLQGYPLRDLLREWSHFNAAVTHALHAAHAVGPGLDAMAFMDAGTLWAALVGEQLSEGALEYQRLHQAEAATKSEELATMLDQLQSAARDRARNLEHAVARLRGGLSTLMTSNALVSADVTAAERAELQAMSRDGVADLDRALSHMLLLSRLEAGLEPREVAPFDAGEALTLLLAGMVPQADRTDGQLTWAGPEHYPVDGDEHRVRMLAHHLVLTALLSDAPGPVDVEWGDDPREASRWVFTVRHHAIHRDGPASPPISRVIAEATDRAQQAAGVPPTGYEEALIEGRIPVASRDGVSLLIAKHLCELLAASIELEADEGIVVFRISLPKAYDRS